MSITEISNRLAIAGVKHVVVTASDAFDRKELHDKLTELRNASKTWNRKAGGVEEVQSACLEIGKYLNTIEDDFPVSAQTKTETVAALSLVSKNLFGGPFPKPTGKDDKELISMFKTFFGLEKKYIADVADSESISDFCAATAFAVKAFAAHLEQYMNS